MKTASVTFIGLVLGIAITFLAIAATIATSAVSGTPAEIPFVFSATVGTENGLPSVEFTPNGLGLLVTVVLITVGYVALRLRARPHP
ncbi:MULTISPECIES: hypothetical protein [Curtobacterium]|jgi:hypothetical protein|uniref:hypothetical protein n=1 Tax=Curtobacterium TaxID=2034 RepID=UPI001BDE67A2|nr:hypothetical protein [Curtobacterium flaccumfaciens]MBT1679809.1 hypothetical protein [Curtobacterium flaccumfaciens pv. flaccumfaciens]